ncbi:lysM domain receptor-like kinase 4 isoform X2 [Neltuma alba]|uniref:lysM domain receptor-like kinase 4 isoform X2 n=1 Tax=Neltuma alba TaxID=207710 RepID=UPI0010A37BB1|nr:lysM domain receptor-like kinase 4 isoform X2 [Prosopis alba]
MAHSCQAYLTFRSQPIYYSVSTISALLGSDPSQLAEINSVSLNATFAKDQLVIVPVNCSCASDYYQTNTSYTIHSTDTYFLIANDTFQGLSTCRALIKENNIPGDLFPGTKLTVPLRCACPTKNQTDKGVKYLLSYLVTWGNSVAAISKRFGAPTDLTLESNSLSAQDWIYPFTTLLVPLKHKPNISRIVVSPPPPSPTSPPSSSPSGGSTNKTWIYAVVGAVGGIALISLLLLGILVFRKRYPILRSEKKDDSAILSESFEATGKPEVKNAGEESETLSEIISDIAQSFKVYGFKELQRATDNFSSNCCIRGGVYRGVINGDLAAIRKMDGDVSKEIAILSKVNHSNVIRLSGVSFSEGHWFLVHEYAANGSLTDRIYVNNTDGKFLTWSQRMQIALDVATGLDYLHSFISPPLIHKDLKSDNILLDADLRAKIANLGLARSVEGEDDQFPVTRHIVGTRGYMAPEYLENGIVSTKQDVYAFGVVMLEILSGKEVAAVHSGDKGSLSDVLSVILDADCEEEKLRDFMDPRLVGKFPLELAGFVVRMIDNCLRKDPASRPAMHDIVSSLSVTLNSSLAWERSVTISGDQSFSRSS